MNAAFLEWTEAHRIGIEMLDYEHQDLFARLNELHEELLRHDEREKIEDCLGEIHARLAAHFALEARFMREKKYVDYARHKAEHDELLDEFVEFMSRFVSDPDVFYGEAEQKTLQHWVLDHVVTSDRRMTAITGGRSGGDAG